MMKVPFLFVFIFYIVIIVSATNCDELIIQGKNYEKNGEYDLALESYNQAITAEKFNYFAHQHKINLLKSIGYKNEAENAEEEQIRCLCSIGKYKNNRLWNKLYEEGIKSIINHNYSEAEKRFLNLLSLCPTDRSTLIYLNVIRNVQNKTVLRQIVQDNRDIFSDQTIQNWLSQEIGDVLSIEPTNPPKSENAGMFNEPLSDHIVADPYYNKDGGNSYTNKDTQKFDSSSQSLKNQENKVNSESFDEENEKSCSCHYQIKEEKNIPSDAILSNNMGAEQFIKKTIQMHYIYLRKLLK